MNFANKISTFRILSVPFFVGSLMYYSPEREYLRFVALAIFIMGVISDAVDGYIARRSKQVSAAGIVLDPLGDKLLLMSAFICLHLITKFPVRFPLWVTLTVVSRDLIILMGVTIVYMIKGTINVLPTRWGKLTTTFQMSAVIALLIRLPAAPLFWWPAVFFTVISGTDYIMRGLKYYMQLIIPGIILSYLLGSIPTAYIFGRLIKGIDIRKFGSGNVGASNALRVLGKGPGVAVLLIDMLKGLAAVTFLAGLLAADTAVMPAQAAPVIFGLACIAGHNWTVFLKFKGGKGVATTFGVLAGLAFTIPGLKLVLMAVIATWLLVYLCTKIISAASLAGALTLPIYMVFFKQSLLLVSLGVILALFVILRHRPNLKRLIQGKEPRTSFKR